MTNSRITLAVMAVASVLIAAAPAEASKARHHQDPSAAPAVDVAAIAPYPTESSPGIQAGRASRGAKASRTARHSGLPAKAAPAASHGPGIVRSAKTGATARVAPRYAARFQAYVDDLEAHGAEVRFMGGYRAGKCWSGGQHPCGKALDVCQLARGVVDRRCHLPNKQAMISIAAAHNLWEGGQWCSQDRGHAQIDQSAARCGSNLYAAVTKFKHRRMAARAGRRL